MSLPCRVKERILLILVNSQKAQELENFGAQKVWAKVKLKIRELTKQLFKKEPLPLLFAHSA